MKFHTKYILGGLLTFASLSQLQAQTTEPNGLGLEDEDKYQVTKSYEPRLQNLEKPVLETPQPGSKEVDPEKMEYEEEKIEVSTVYTPPKPKITNPPKETVERLQNNLLKVGFGRFATPLVELYLNNGRNDQAQVGLDFTHLSSSSGHVDYGEFRKDYGTLKGEYYLDENTIYSKVFVNNSNFFYYADSILATNPEFKDSLRQTYTQIQADVGLMKNYSTDGLFYDVGLRFKSYSDRFQNRDLHFSLLPKFGWSITDNISAGIDAGLTFSNTRFDTSRSRNFIEFTPYAQYATDRFEARAGLKVNSFSDTTNAFGAYPMLSAAFQLIPERVNVKAGLQGEMKYNQYYELMKENQYLLRQADILPTREKINLYASVDGNFAKYFNFNARAYTRKVENQLIFFVEEQGAYFQTVYDTNFRESGAELSLVFNKSNKIKAGMTGKFRSFKTSNIAHNYNVPNTRFDLWGSYNFADKVLITTEIYVFGKRTMSLDSSGVGIEQPAQADINLSADYRFSKRISVFLELNNILSNQYYRWHNYLERPLDIKAGVTLAF